MASHTATTVQTVLGPVAPDDLGRTLMHEHIFVLTSDVQANYPGEWGDEDARVADAVGRLRELADAGVRTIVDPTVVGLGRDIPRIRRVAEQVPGLNIVVATGVYTYTDVPNFFRFRGPGLGPGAPDPMVDMFVSDIVDGITGTDVRAGLLKCAIDSEGLTNGVERVMRAIGEAHHRTGVPVMVHTHPGSRTGLHVRRVLADEGGVQPSRILLAHSGDTTDVDHLTELAEAGFVLGMDRMGLNTELTFEQRCDTVVEMCGRGFGDQLVLSQDASCYIDWIDPNVRPMLTQWHYLHVLHDVLPYLAEHGVTADQITAMLVANPLRFLSPQWTG